MPRNGRRKSQSGIYHIMLRGINRQRIFEDEEDYDNFLQVLKVCKERSGYCLYAYCLMGNHIHLLLKEETEGLEIIMRRIGASYVYWYNWKYQRCGHLFQDRYKSEVVEDEKYLLTVLRYIHQNPLKAGLVKDLKDYQWSSYLEYLNGPDLVDAEYILDILSNNEANVNNAFHTFHEIISGADVMDIEEKRRLTDEEALRIIKKKCPVRYGTDLQLLEVELRNQYLKILKQEGLSTRQLARLTGIPRGLIIKV